MSINSPRNLSLIVVIKLKIAVIGGTGLEALMTNVKVKSFTTPFGYVEAAVGYIDGEEILFIPRHGFKHEYPPHKVKYKGNIFLCKKLGVEWIIATSAVGSLREDIPPGTIVIPTDLIDYTKNREYTFFNDITVHIDFTRPYCEKLGEIIYLEAKRLGLNVVHGGTYVCFEGPRFETPSEIKMFKLLGADIVGMTNVPESILARELSMHYSLIALVTNYAAGIQHRVSQDEVYEIMEKFRKNILDLVLNVVNKVKAIDIFKDYCLENEENARKFVERWESANTY